jgi:hypothetical protein
MDLVFGTSNKGHRTLFYRSFEFIKECDNVSGSTSWRCRFHLKLKCKARLVTADNRVIADKQPHHTHEGNVATSLARCAVAEMKDAMSELMATPMSAQSAVASKLDNQVLMALPKRSSLKRTLQRAKTKLATANGDVLPAVPADLRFTIPEQFEDMVLYDSGPGEDRMILMGCPELLDGLSRADVWLADGTFKVVPSVFFQLYTMHFNFGSGINPVGLYCLLANKTGATYGRVLEELQRLIPYAGPRKILVDFERAAMTTFSMSYPNATVTGCYFHLCQSVIRKVNEIGLKVLYESDNDVRTYVRCLPALAFVPPEDVLEAFELLVDTMPNDVDHMDEITSFFEHTYIRGRRQRGRGEIYGPAIFTIELWNQHAAGADGIARTTNSVEGWHYGLQSLFQCHHPTMWSFMAGLKRDMQQQKTLFLHATTGVEHPSAKTFRTLNRRILNAVRAYGRAEILMYLRGIAHLSHT